MSICTHGRAECFDPKCKLAEQKARIEALERAGDALLVSISDLLVTSNEYTRRQAGMAIAHYEEVRGK